MITPPQHSVWVFVGAILFFAPTVSAEIRLISHVDSAADSTSWIEVTQLLDDFTQSSEPAPTGRDPREYCHYGRLAGDWGNMDGGTQQHSLIVADGVLTATVASGPQGTSWVGRWYSTIHMKNNMTEVLNFSAPLSPFIKEDWQPIISALYARVKGTGTFRIELRENGDNPPLHSSSTSDAWGPDFEEVSLSIADPTRYPAVKLINLSVESPSLLMFDEIGIKLSVPEWLYADILKYTFATSYAALLRGFDPTSGYTRDHVQWPAGHFDSLPGCGFQALGAALAYDLGLLTSETARHIASCSIAAISQTTRYQGLLPHWIEQGTPKDWSTVDTGLALLSSLLACKSLEMSSEEIAILKMIDAINWAPLVNSQGQVAHGYRNNRSLSPYVWSSWDGEGAIVQILRLLQDPQAPLFQMDASAPIYGGRGFIAEIAGLFAPQFAIWDREDRYGINWRTLRSNMLGAQKAYYPTNHPESFAAMAGLYGLSPIEVIDQNSNTTYCEAGVGTASVPANDGGGWVCPHYAAMAGSLDLDSLIHFLTTLRQAGLLQPLIGLPEGIKAGNSGITPEGWHSAQITLNEFFNVVGLYHAILRRDGGTDVVYESALSNPRLISALNTLFPEINSCR
jgi:hypothetical protein